MKIRWVERIDGAFLLEPTPAVDERGFFSRTFDSAVAREAGIEPDQFVQDSVSRSFRGVLRGLHVRGGSGEAKLVRCSYGAVFDVVVDLRPSSPTFRIWQSFDLNGDAQTSLFIPRGCAHGFQALSEIADVSYRIDRPHDPTEDIALRFDDPELGIQWPLPVGLVSRRDRRALSLEGVLAALRPRVPIP